MGAFSLIIKPDADEAEAAEIYVDGRIGGRAYRFLLDTGAGKSSVVSDDYTSTFDSAEKHHSSGVFAKSSEDLITVPSIEVGSISRENFTLVRAAPIPGAAERSSLIGMDLLKDFRLHLFFDQARVSVDEDAGAPDYAVQDLMLDDRFHPYVEVQFEAASAKAVWDTGASLTIVDMAFVKKHPGAFQEVGQSTGTDATGAQMETPMFVMAATTIGGCEFPSHRAAGVDLSAVNAMLDVPMDIILGYSTLRQANWLFDFPRRKWAVTKRLSV
ncbi:MAG: aspartyl protease family protein [Chloroflexota bacterium]